MGNEFRYLNDCNRNTNGRNGQPNIKLIPACLEGGGEKGFHLMVIATAKISKNEELLLDYSLTQYHTSTTPNPNSIFPSQLSKELENNNNNHATTTSTTTTNSNPQILISTSSPGIIQTTVQTRPLLETPH